MTKYYLIVFEGASQWCSFSFLKEYLALTKSEACHPDVWVNLACCYFFLGMYNDADNMAQKGSVRESLFTTLSLPGLNLG